MPEAVAEATRCRACGAAPLPPVFDLGSMPPSDGFTSSPDAVEPRYPLRVAVCEGCGLAQLQHTVDPTLLFADDFLYFSSYSRTVVHNAAEAVCEALARRPVSPDGLVVEIASNDGYLLEHVRARGLTVLGIEPVERIAAVARRHGIDTIRAFFSRRLAEELVAAGRRADVVFANNVLAHVPTVRDFVQGLRVLLSETGLAVLEVPSLEALFAQSAFDTIYHEHVFYFSLPVLDELFRREGLHLNDVREIPIHGGSYRLFVERRARPTARLQAALAAARSAGSTDAERFAGLQARVRWLGERLRGLLTEIRAGGGSVAAYGAAAKGTILLNACGIDRRLVAYVADRNPHKQGLFVPGVKIPIVSPGAIATSPPDVLLVLPWNHRREIRAQLDDFTRDGRRMLFPIPEPQFVAA